MGSNFSANFFPFQNASRLCKRMQPHSQLCAVSWHAPDCSSMLASDLSKCAAVERLIETKRPHVQIFG